MKVEYILKFIKQKDFEEHVHNTLKQYQRTLKSIDLKQFNSNVIDPIKLLFDKKVFNQTFEQVIELEIQRQRDKTNNNTIGYFHQNIFNYIAKCEVPKQGWDIVYHGKKGTYYIEAKNKHNTMNSSSSAKTYMRMQSKLLEDHNAICALVEVIAKQSQNIPWVITLDKQKQPANERLRRISIDRFYHLVTGDKLAFRKLCHQLPITIDKILEQDKSLTKEEDSVLQELHNLDSDILHALYKLAFSTYEGFDFITNTFRNL